ncbi:MAG: DUF3052 domain-containing protein [Boseongicola sp.]|nr:MAG: DUF3052 domain-containing protein [Boseongicola sp.]
MPAPAGYSGTPLAKKLGLKDGHSAAFAGLPPSLDWLPDERALMGLQKTNDWTEIDGNDLDYIHLFTDSAATVDAATPKLRDQIKPDGMIWMSWPKKASKVPTDVTEDTIRNRALQDILVDVKVCAVDDIWSGLKLVIRKEHRP